jgi:hypothetical protein
MQVGNYYLNQSVKEIERDSLKEFTILEYHNFPTTFKGEKLYRGEKVFFIDNYWDSIVGIIDGKIYKIALDGFNFEDDKSDEILFKLSEKFGNESGQYHQLSDDYFWDTEWGNIIYSKIGNGYNALYFTSNSIRRKVKFKKTNRLIPQLFNNYSDEEIKRWLLLRSIEWTTWPAYLSQAIIPMLLIYFVWWHVLSAFVVLSIIWTFIRYKYVNPYLSQIGAIFSILKWPSAILASAFLVFNFHYAIAILALIWPVGISAFVGIPGKIGRVEVLLAQKIGYKNK